MVFQLAYCSIGTSEPTPEVLRSILRDSDVSNRSKGITGILMYNDRLFFQVLEGERETVQRLFERILQDPRHTAVTLLWQGDAPQRCFSEWGMGYAGPKGIPDLSAGALVSLAEVRAKSTTPDGRDATALALAENVQADFEGGRGFRPPRFQ